MGDQLSVVNTILGIVVAVFAIYEFVAKIRRAKSLDKTAASAVVISLMLIGVALYVFVYKPVVPNEVSQAFTAEEGGIPVVQPQQPSQPITIQKEYLIDVTNNTHKGFSPSSRAYNQRFNAEPGHIIISYEWVATSVNNSSGLSFNIENDGSAIVASFSLKAGSVLDRWRGWMKGRILTTQVKL